MTGATVGSPEGSSVREWVGSSVGSMEGCCGVTVNVGRTVDGRTVGDRLDGLQVRLGRVEGDIEGQTDGGALGSREGISLGELEEVNDGVVEGTRDGRRVGLMNVGAVVGDVPQNRRQDFDWQVASGLQHSPSRKQP